MRLTQYTDYSLRVLIFLALQPDRRCTIREISEAYGVSRNHLMKVVQQLSGEGFVSSTRGVGGGLTLAQAADKLVIGQIVRVMEPDLALVECMRPENACVITGACRLQSVLDEGRAAFLKTLDRYTVADLVQGRDSRRLSDALGLRVHPD